MHLRWPASTRFQHAVCGTVLSCLCCNTCHVFILTPALFAACSIQGLAVPAKMLMEVFKCGAPQVGTARAVHIADSSVVCFSEENLQQNEGVKRREVQIATGQVGSLDVDCSANGWFLHATVVLLWLAVSAVDAVACGCKGADYMS